MSNVSHPLDISLPDMFRSGRRLRGVFNSIPSPAIVEMCAYAGFDFLLIDNEHGSASLETTEHMLRAARAGRIPALVRCLEQDIARTLDIGACGVQIPMVNTASHAAKIVQQVKYPLCNGVSGVSGQRGSAFSTRAAGYGAFGGAEHTQRSNKGIAVVVMIETLEGVTNAAEIAAVEGIDAVFIGPNDLAHSMGHGAQWTDAPVQAAIEKALKALQSAGTCPGILALSLDDEDRYAAWGARYFATVTTGIFVNALRQAAMGTREKVQY